MPHDGVLLLETEEGSLHSPSSFLPGSPQLAQPETKTRHEKIVWTTLGKNNNININVNLRDNTSLLLLENRLNNSCWCSAHISASVSSC